MLPVKRGGKMAQVEIISLKKAFGATMILSDVSALIPDGAFAVLVGPSGCGKSTLLRLIAGLEQPSGGDISIGNQSVIGLTPQERDIAMVFQNYALYPHMTVAENMGFALKLKGVDKARIQEEVRSVADKLSLAPLLDRLPKQLSGGQRQRVAMGRAIVRQPKAFLFDEPLSNLDAKLRVQMRAEIRALHQQLATTSIYVTHDQVEAMTMGDIIIVLDAGKVAQAGSPSEIYSNPASRFVAEFIGSPAMNFVDGVLDKQGFAGPAGFQLSTRVLADNRKAHLGFRPENAEIADAGNGIPMTVTVVENTGPERHIRGLIDGNPATVVLRADAILPTTGSLIHVRPKPGTAYFFDSMSGERIHEDATG
jgi:multiple sugar transport system ATP-binding protein